MLGRLVFPSALPSGRRRSLDPHGLVLLLAAAVLFSTWFVADYSREKARGSTAECVVLEMFFESPGLLASFERTPEELQRWEDAYDRDCR
jgi:hypothetical protein